MKKVLLFLAVIAGYTDFHFGVIEGIFDASGFQWKARQAPTELSRIRRVRENLITELYSSEPLWGTLIDFRDGKVGLVIEKEREFFRVLRSDGIRNVSSFQPDWTIQSINRVVPRTDWEYDQKIREFFRR